MVARRGRKRQWHGQSVYALRIHLGLTQQAMADEMGTRQQTISEWERGMYKPRGASARLLTIIAERAGFEYQAGGQSSEERQPNRVGDSIQGEVGR